MKNLKAIFSYLLSYLKSNWAFGDYPLETWQNANSDEDAIRYGAGFTNWAGFVAHGNTRAIAIENLRNNFDEYRNEHELPRPGSKVPLKLASTQRIDEFEDIAVDFFDKILGKNYYNCFISDLSSLHDFMIDEDIALQNIKAIYGVEPEGEYLILVDIFELIRHERG